MTQDKLAKGELKKDEKDGTLREDGRIWVPMSKQNLRLQLVRSAHNSATAAHRSKKQTLARLKKFTWTHMAAMVENHVDSCQACLKAKNFTAKKHGLMGDFDVPDLPFEHVHIDFSGPISKDKSRRIVIVVDRLTR